jgi:hypothetical protein
MFDARFLAIPFIAAILLRERGLGKACVILFSDWAVLTACYWITGEPFNVPLTLSVDLVAAEFLLIGMRTRWEAALVATYAIEMIAHASYALGSQGAWSQYLYWWTLNDVAWLQAGLCLAWGGWTGGRRLVRFFVDRRVRRQRDCISPAYSCAAASDEGGYNREVGG